MSSTNKTTYYDLPQFVDTDLFNPLVDDNDAYNKIDTALHQIADAVGDNVSEIASVKSRVTTAEGKIEALETQNGDEVLTTTAQTLSGAVNELGVDVASLDNRVDVVEDDINNANTGLKAKVTALETQNGNEALTTTAQTISGAVNELDDDTTSINSFLGNRTLDTTATDVSGAINELNSDYTDVNAFATRNANRLANVKSRKIIIIGDSYERSTEFGSHVSEDLGHGIPAFITTNCRKSPDGYIYIASRGGAGFTNTDQGMLTGNGFLNLLTELTAELTSEERADIDCILIAGGVNDSSVNAGDSDITMLNENMLAFKNYVLSNYPKAQVNIFMLGRVRQLDTHDGRNPKDVRYNIYRYIDIAGRLGWGYIANSEYVTFRYDSLLSSDNLHPIPDYGYAIAGYICEGLYNGSVDVTWIDNPIYLLTPTDEFSNHALAMSCNLVNGIKTVKIRESFGFLAVSPITLQFGQPYKIATQNAMYVIEPTEVFVPFEVWDETNNKFEMMNGVLRFYGYDVFIVYRGAPSYGNSNIKISSILAPSHISFMIDTLIT